MRPNEFKAFYDKCEKEYKRGCEQLRFERNRKTQEAANEVARSIARFKVGDILEADNRIIEVTLIKALISPYYKDMICVTYHGLELTKKLQPRKDGNRFDIYDDGREITKI